MPDDCYRSCRSIRGWRRNQPGVAQRGRLLWDLDPEHFQVPRAEGLVEGWDNLFDRHPGDSLHLVAELGGQVIGWLGARIEPPGRDASAELTREQGWTRLFVASLIVDRAHWRSGAGAALLEAAEAWGREHGAQVARLDTYAYSPVSVPFYEDHMGCQRRSIVFQKRL